MITNVPNIPTDADAAPEYCAICETRHHPRWHDPMWRERMWEAVNRAKALGNGAEMDRLRDAVANPTRRSMRGR